MDPATLNAREADQEVLDDRTTALEDNAYTDEKTRDAIGVALRAGTNVSLSVDDASDTITINATTPATDAEFIRDTIGTALIAGANITITVSDAGDTITVAISGVPTTTAMNAAIAAAGDVKVDSTTVDTIVTLTQAAYDALGTKNSRTAYFITG